MSQYARHPVETLLDGHADLQEALTKGASAADALLLESGKGGSWSNAYEQFRGLAIAVLDHLDREEASVFPLLRATEPKPGTVASLERDHRTLRALASEVGWLNPQASGSAQRLAMLLHEFVELFHEHTAREETVVCAMRNSRGPRAA
jgi:hypothetical protein